MGSVYPRGTKLWLAYNEADGERVCRPSGFSVGEDALARRLLEEIEAQIAAGQAVDSGPITLTKYAAKWIEGRRARGLATVDDDNARLRDHVLPRIGHMRMTEIRPRNIRDVVLALRARPELAPRTVRKVYGVMSTLFRNAVADEVIPATPCVLQRGVLPKNADKDPNWRVGAIFDRLEVERLISDDRLLLDRRVLYGLKGLAALRHSEAATLRWSQFDATARPLGRINLGKTKSGVPRSIPVHPALAALLARWKLSGWRDTYGQMPTADDLIVPTRNMTVRAADAAQVAFREDLERLGLRRRRGHDLRRTFISLALEDGARRDLLEVVTHGPRGDIISVYSTFPWPALCAEVAKLNISLRLPEVVAFPVAAVVGETMSTDPDEKPTTATVLQPRLRSVPEDPDDEPPTPRTRSPRHPSAHQGASVSRSSNPVGVAFITATATSGCDRSAGPRSVRGRGPAPPARAAVVGRRHERTFANGNLELAHLSARARTKAARSRRPSCRSWAMGDPAEQPVDRSGGGVAAGTNALLVHPAPLCLDVVASMLVDEDNSAIDDVLQNLIHARRLRDEFVLASHSRNRTARALTTAPTSRT